MAHRPCKSRYNVTATRKAGRSTRPRAAATRYVWFPWCASVLWCVNSGVLRPDPGTTEAVIMITKDLLLSAVANPSRSWKPASAGRPENKPLVRKAGARQRLVLGERQATFT